MVGALFASLIHFYIAFARDIADFGQEVSTDRPDVVRHFVDGFLFAGTVPGILFWGGGALAIAGAILQAARPRRTPH
jgi:hypothetical protein